MIIVAVTDRDARPSGRSRQEVAQEYALTIRHALTTFIEQTSVRTLLINGAFALLDTVILIAFLVVFHTLFPKLYEKLRSWRGAYIPPIKVQRVEVLPADQIATPPMRGVCSSPRTSVQMNRILIGLLRAMTQQPHANLQC